MSNDTMPKKIWVMRTCWSEEKNPLRLDPPPPEVSYTRTDTIPSQWIDVKDKLPETGSFVIVYNRSLDAVMGGVYYDNWSDNSGDGFDEGDITHWMLMPRKPQYGKPAPSKAEAAREFVDKFMDSIIDQDCDFFDAVDSLIRDYLKEWEDAKSK